MATVGNVSHDVMAKGSLAGGAWRRTPLEKKNKKLTIYEISVRKSGSMQH